MKKSYVYLDYAAATPIDKEVLLKIQQSLEYDFANAHSIHGLGIQAKKTLYTAREKMAQYLHASPQELQFTHGGTDSNIQAIHGVLNSLLDSGVGYHEMHIILSAIEHSSVRGCMEWFARRGVALSICSVSKEGIVDLHRLGELIKPNTVLVSVMYVNNEIGTIQPISEIGKLLNTKQSSHRALQRPLLHTDAVQAPLFLPIHVDVLQSDLLTLDSQKMYGPKGAGLLYVKKGTSFTSLCGAQGTKDTSGTPNVAAIIGFVESFRIAEERRTEDATRTQALREYCIERILERFPKAHINGSRTERAPNNINVSFEGTESEFLIVQLDYKGIAASSKSACLLSGGEGSYVVAALDPRYASSAVRFSLGRETTQDDIDYLISVLSELIY